MDADEFAMALQLGGVLIGFWSVLLVLAAGYGWLFRAAVRT